MERPLIGLSNLKAPSVVLFGAADVSWGLLVVESEEAHRTS
jgi:hypothetical protein